MNPPQAQNINQNIKQDTTPNPVAQQPDGIVDNVKKTARKIGDTISKMVGLEDIDIKKEGNKDTEFGGLAIFDDEILNENKYKKECTDEDYKLIRETMNDPKLLDNYEVVDSFGRLLETSDEERPIFVKKFFDPGCYPPKRKYFKDSSESGEECFKDKECIKGKCVNAYYNYIPGKCVSEDQLDSTTMYALLHIKGLCTNSGKCVPGYQCRKILDSKYGAIPQCSKYRFPENIPLELKPII